MKHVYDHLLLTFSLESEPTREVEQRAYMGLVLLD